MKVKQNIKNEGIFIFSILVIGFIAGAIYSINLHSNLSLYCIFSGGIIGLIISLICAIIEFIFFINIRHFAFIIQLITKTVTYSIVGVSVVYLSYFIKGSSDNLLSDPIRVLTTIMITLGISLVANFIMAIRRVLGKHIFSWLLIGRYRIPVEEIRMFMFLDLASSTDIAEKIGHVKYHQLIHKFWCDIADIILKSKGDIYKYVGDEVIVTWHLVEAKLNNDWLECYFEIKDRMHYIEQEYRHLFGTIPQFRTSLHCGMVVVGEMGDWKREVGFIGDTLNTTARILEICKTINKDFLISKDVLQRTANIEQYKIEEIPETVLRGRQNKIRLFGVERKKL